MRQRADWRRQDFAGIDAPFGTKLFRRRTTAPSKGKQIQTGANRRNGHTSKTIQTHVEPMQDPPTTGPEGDTDRLVGKWDRKLNSGFDAQIIELYSLGNSLEDIQFHLKRMYGNCELSTSQLSTITEQVRGYRKMAKTPVAKFLYPFVPGCHPF
ncbi:MAG: transposase [Saprospiraceae bacterium]